MGDPRAARRSGRPSPRPPSFVSFACSALAPARPGAFWLADRLPATLFSCLRHPPGALGGGVERRVRPASAVGIPRRLVAARRKVAQGRGMTRTRRVTDAHESKRVPVRLFCMHDQGKEKSLTKKFRLLSFTSKEDCGALVAVENVLPYFEETQRSVYTLTREKFNIWTSDCLGSSNTGTLYTHLYFGV